MGDTEEAAAGMVGVAGYRGQPRADRLRSLGSRFSSP